ncbi:hydrogenase nickel incorporation protein HypA/HybF [Clostridium cavendishii DSM 21758]|uniref:Hydrogenase nickel incorporation protein HypA/HybF n=1 Tax=Clostridium cavendishii DSM 21758 TaxID=1121302 RepID=A0A1M6HX25_9CLOT|nr:hydrogenase maturation nickel metallochaperone HypA [Clostridium cavendishii]SHJ26723.1 hydrogenase nickel incorporation protein HypA/HybF [Clostridium cavendishii DSM 21758]
MHEASIAFEIYEIVQENINLYKLKNVTLIVIKVGSFNGIDKASLKFAFEAISKGTKCKDAKIVIEEIKGFELMIERIEGEEDEEYRSEKKNTTI